MEKLELIKERIKRTKLWTQYEIKKWEQEKQPIHPPSSVKAKIIKEYAKQFSIDTMIETGTYLGDMIGLTRGFFNQIYSIELSNDLYQKAKKRFKKYSYICIMHGNSSEVLPKLLSSIDKPCLFWLDAHYSGEETAKGDLDTPIISELEQIFLHKIKDHVILIDDAREFIGSHLVINTDGSPINIYYPKIESLKDFVNRERPDYIFEVADDIIRIHK